MRLRFSFKKFYLQSLTLLIFGCYLMINQSCTKIDIKDELINYELSQAFIANKFKIEITLAKMDALGNFKPIFVNELPDPAEPTKKYTNKPLFVT